MFGTSGVRGPVGDELTAQTALSVGRALPSCGYTSVVVGRDPRDSGRMLTNALIAGVQECGGEVITVGQATTPTIARSVMWMDADAGVAVTASHNPPEDNGLKLWTPSGQAFDAEQRAEITACIDNEEFDFAPWDQIGTSRRAERVVDRHIRAITEDVSTPIEESVIVDVGNGAGGMTATALTQLGCDVETLNAQPDGSFPGRPSEPTAETCSTLRTLVEETDASLGIAHDGDADRMLAVDESGRFVPGDVLLAIFAQETATAGDTVAMPVDTSLAVEDNLAERGIDVRRTQVGDVYVAEAATDNDVVFGGEPRGAWIWPNETLCPDGPLAACKLATLVSESDSLAALAESIETYPIRRRNIQTTNKYQLMEQVESIVTDQFEPSALTTLDGVRVDQSTGWFLIRASGTQPLVRVTAEAKTEDNVELLLQTATEVVKRGQEGCAVKD